MKIIRAIIITGEGRDRVSLETDLPDTCIPPFDNLSLRFSAPSGKAEQYIKKHLPEVTEIQVLDLNDDRSKGVEDANKK
jgi:hypothetical protein